ncbi:hypothetical protein CULT_1170015 [[Clostridium] ultunense Esp]|nr:hypothetical protein CULT_1170015 [[Clostridium] ultunense Esp]
MRRVNNKCKERIENIVVEKLFLKGDIYLDSPLAIGSGADDNSDNDIQRDSMGNPFIPGTSLAGVFKEYLCNNYDSTIGKEIFGEIVIGLENEENNSKKESNDNRLSKVIVYDGYFDEGYIISIRDGVELDINKRAVDKSKYDYEIIEPCTFFKLKMEIDIRENDRHNKEKYIEAIDYLLCALIQGKIYIGGKVSRGFGRVSLDRNSLKYMVVNLESREDLSKLLDFNWESKYFVDYEELKIIDKEDQIVEIETKITVPNSFIIRRYSGSQDDVDYESIRSYHSFDETVPVIPGTSWAGVFMHNTVKILDEILKNSYRDIPKDVRDIIIKQFIDELFFEDIIKREDNKEIRARSKIFFDETVILDSVPIKQTRIKIDRFTGGAAEGALYDSKAEYLGHGILNIRILEKDDANVILGMILLILKDLDNGLITVGGETAIGRGILRIDGDIRVNGTNEYDSNEYYNALARKIKGIKEGLDNE